MNRILHLNWKYQLLNTVLRSEFFIAPGQLDALAPVVSAIVNKDKDIDQALNPGQLTSENNQFPILATNAVDGLFDNLDKAPDGSTAIISIKGTMLKYGTWCSYGTEEIAQAIIYAANHAKINSIVLDIDSGGGAVNAVAPIVQAVEYAQSKSKPVVASVDMACSAAYWAAACTDWIIADNAISSSIGSIGVMVSFWDVKGYYEKLGYKLHTIYAPESTHKNAEFEAAMAGEYDKIKEATLSPLAKDFQNAVTHYRAGKLNKDVEGVLAGRVFFAKEAMAAGLIDEIGNRRRAVIHAQDLASTWNYLKS